MSLVQYNISFIGTSADPNSREDGFFEEVGIPRSLWWDKKTMLMYKTLLFVIFWMVSLIYIYIYCSCLPWYIYQIIWHKYHIRAKGRKHLVPDMAWAKEIIKWCLFHLRKCHHKMSRFQLDVDHPHAQMPNSRLAARQPWEFQTPSKIPWRFQSPFL